MDNKIKEKFYPLTPEITKKLRNAKLTAAEWRLWSYLIELDPFGDRYQDLPNTLTVMQEVDIKKTTFYTALGKFQKLGLFDFQDKGFAFRNLRGIPKNQKAVRENGKFSEISETIPKNRKVIREIGNNSKKSENQSPEAISDKGSESSQTIQTYSDLIRSLSEGERENFLNFGLEKCKSLPKLPELPMKWIEANWQELYAQFKSTRCSKATAIAETDWTNHPDWEDWLRVMREGVPRFVALGTCFDRKTRRAIAYWAEEQGLIWGVES